MVSNRYKSLFSFIFILFLTFVMSGTLSSVSAQEKLNVRAGDHKGYSRLVFDWKSAATYNVEEEGEKLIVSFQKPAQVSIGGVQDIKNIGTVSLLSADGEKPKFAVSIAPDSKYRHFKIGNRVMVDVYDSAGEPSRSASSLSVPKSQASTAEPENAAKKEAEKETVKANDIAKAPSEKSLSNVAEAVQSQSDFDRNPHVITLSSTRNVGLAVFERSGYLWIVQDDASLKIPPTISGVEKGQSEQFEEIEMVGGKAYRMPTPEGTSFYGEGGGLLWRILMTPNPRAKKPVKMETRENKTVNGIQRSVYFPLNTANKILTLKDPLIGDDIKIVTAEDSGQTIGPARQMVDMKILPSTVGLALIPYIDDLDIQITGAGVNLSRATGLAVSPLSDTASLTLQDDVEKEEAAFERKENPRDMTQIFDFERWEMGGEQALNENRRILMVAAGNKQGSSKVQELMTMAKLNLANDRGAEALGLLRVAEQELPGIEETPEFKAIRGASATLAGKYDEALDALLDPALERFDEINYWKAAALKGVEDWQQADKVMPIKFEILAEYPQKIKRPLVLSLIEVALRAGNLNIAERLLAMLEGEFLEMSIPRQSAWKYLQGEKERQSDNPEQALKNWEQLLTGKDDYHRAKAGLSVTKMQLERKKITPAKAIDRLEGLRYAWRGDELETTINFRLGKIYIENGDYLKGLSVLRGAIGLSPNEKTSEEVTSYMTTTFRNLFTDGTLDNVSPLDAISIYDEFKELTPAGDAGNVFVQNLAERLVNAELLGRASALLEDQMNFRLKGLPQAKVGVRLAAIRLLDGKPDGAIKALDVAQSALRGVTGTSALEQEIRMLRARALSKMGEANKALRLLQGLPNSENIAKLRADVAWNGGLWNDASNAFKNLIAHEAISLTRPMSEYEENLILNYSIALNLSGNRSALANVRDRYGDLMKQSEKSRIFDLVTRPRKLGLVEDRESIMSLISEVDLFGGFLENYKSSQ